MSKNLSELSGRKGLQDNLFEELGILSREAGTASPEQVRELAESFLFGTANVYGTASFYDLTRPENKGKKVYVCNGSACLTAGTQPALQNKLSQYFRPEEIGHMTCLGRCHENHAFYYDGKNHSACSDAQLNALFSEKKKKPVDQYHVEALGTAALTAEIGDLDTYYLLLWNRISKGSAPMLDEIKASGIRGRGGAGFPMGIKLESCRNEVSDRKFIVCNADEGDPGAYSDRYILEQRVHALLFGMMVAGFICGAEWGVVYIRAEYPEAVETCENAVRELYERGWLGKHIKGTAFSFDFKVIRAQGAYICGEETALLNSIEGQRPEVRTRPPFPTQQGLFNRPTVVNNVETLASLHYILEKGGAHYAAIGTEKSKGTKLVSLDSHFNRPGIYEVEMGVSLRKVIDELGKGFRHEIKAMQIGGPLGGIVPVSKIDALTVDFESFSSNGFLLGHASVVCIPQSFSMVEYVEHLFEFAAYESCGKCFPCRLGTTRGHELFHKARHSGYKIPPALLDDLLFTLQTGSLCAHGGGIPLPVRNALQYFPEEFSQVMAGN
ncbi:MAG: NAD(P)H-dependent oxidoreductase subunit E [Flavobacteriales bacterium]|nr:NAD(P)H-dependent oxidoreductase subunit E [Flavobacteriales bacterium]